MASTTTAALRARIESTVRNCLLAHRDGAAQQDASVISRGLAPTCTRQVTPASFARSFNLEPEALKFGNDAYEAQFVKDLEVSAVARTDILDLTIDVGVLPRRAAARTDNVLKMADGEEIGLEFAWFFELSEDGGSITKIVEFCDPVEAKRFQGRVDALREEKQKKAAGATVS